MSSGESEELIRHDKPAPLGDVYFSRLMIAGRPVGPAYDPASDTLAEASNGSEIRLWRLAERHLLTRLSGHSDAVAALAFAADGKSLASGSHDRSVRPWDLSKTSTAAGETTMFGNHCDVVTDVAFAGPRRVLSVP